MSAHDLVWSEAISWSHSRAYSYFYVEVVDVIIHLLFTRNSFEPKAYKS
jgi:hypothetical protein